MEIVRKFYSFLLDSLQTFLIAAAIFLVIYVFLFRPFEVKGDSMYPNFHDGEYILTNIISLRFNNPKLGDVIVFNAPPNPQEDYIKRVIGVPGDTIMLKNGDVYLNGKLLDESSFLNPSVKTYGMNFLKDNQTIKIPRGNYFVMGDNREYSSDSRDWGLVPRSVIVGESFFVYWPLNRMRIVQNPF